ncbi:HEPN domain-containing protein [Burkholderia cenocepacia]|uniref:HEPN domain-containing protein n=1 Tax=Burkholderia cenocepacia TaxID=95486 RepID=UPI00265435CF|nr:HEPN domain-containing protein [Burkholderia cenocepacia]MDN7694607.1 HEPN domain-containing protein [Burkholderia cenocepacia]
MAYKKSRPRVELDNAFNDIKSRLKLVEGRSTNPAIRDYVIAASIFLAHAEIENFVEDVLSSFAIGIQAAVSKGSKLPGYLQSHLFLTKSNAIKIYSGFLSQNSEKDLLKAFSVAIKGVPGNMIDDSRNISPFTGHDIYGKLKYPSHENLKKIFTRLGVENLFDELSRILKKDSKSILESLGSLRTQLAHTGTLPGVSCRDVRDRIDDAGRFVGALDRVVFSITAKQLGSNIWATHLC